MVFCGNCGQQNAAGMKFCSGCGSALGQAGGQQQPVMQPPGVVQSFEPPPPQYPMQSKSFEPPPPQFPMKSQPPPPPQQQGLMMQQRQQQAMGSQMQQAMQQQQAMQMQSQLAPAPEPIAAPVAEVMTEEEEEDMTLPDYNGQMKLDYCCVDPNHRKNVAPCCCINTHFRLSLKSEQNDSWWCCVPCCLVHDAFFWVAAVSPCILCLACCDDSCAKDPHNAEDQCCDQGSSKNLLLMENDTWCLRIWKRSNSIAS